MIFQADRYNTERCTCGHARYWHASSRVCDRLVKGEPCPCSRFRPALSERAA